MRSVRQAGNCVVLDTIYCSRQINVAIRSAKHQPYFRYETTANEQNVSLQIRLIKKTYGEHTASTNALPDRQEVCWERKKPLDHFRYFVAMDTRRSVATYRFGESSRASPVWRRRRFPFVDAIAGPAVRRLLLLFATGAWTMTSAKVGQQFRCSD